MYEGKKLYGPYIRKDGRQVVVLKTPGSVNDLQTVSYPKYLVEMHIGRYLEKDETVDHIDGDFNNNDLDNLRIVPRSEHARSHTIQKETHTKRCVICGKEFTTKENSRVVCGSPSCIGKCAHINGYNKGNNFIREDNTYQDNRYILQNIESVKNKKN